MAGQNNSLTPSSMPINLHEMFTIYSPDSVSKENINTKYIPSEGLRRRGKTSKRHFSKIKAKLANIRYGYNIE